MTIDLPLSVKRLILAAGFALFMGGVFVGAWVARWLFQ